jgi:hypothetical protein
MAKYSASRNTGAIDMKCMPLSVIIQSEHEVGFKWENSLKIEPR